jgi:hypothetical protein
MDSPSDCRGVFQLSIHFAPSIRLGLASAADVSAAIGVAGGARWDQNHLSDLNISALPNIICYPAPAVHVTPANANMHSVTSAVKAPVGMTIDYSGDSGSTGVDYNSIADGLRRCAQRGRFIKDYNDAMSEEL